MPLDALENTDFFGPGYSVQQSTTIDQALTGGVKIAHCTVNPAVNLSSDLRTAAKNPLPWKPWFSSMLAACRYPPDGMNLVERQFTTFQHVTTEEIRRGFFNNDPNVIFIKFFFFDQCAQFVGWSYLFFKILLRQILP